MYLGKIANKLQSYIVSLDIKDIGSLPMKFDTGATFTTIPYKSLVEIQMNWNNNFYITYYGILHGFNTASGTEMKGILCSIKNVNIKGIKFDDFYFFITAGTRKTGLLGYEVIDSCEFSHQVNSDIILSGFNKQKYIQHVQLYKRESNIVEQLTLEECYSKYIKPIEETNKTYTKEDISAIKVQEALTVESKVAERFIKFLVLKDNITDRDTIIKTVCQKTGIPQAIVEDTYNKLAIK